MPSAHGSIPLQLALAAASGHPTPPPGMPEPTSLAVLADDVPAAVGLSGTFASLQLASIVICGRPLED